MNLTHYLKDFLLQGGIVEIPTLGMFYTEYTPAHFNEESHVFSPSKRNIIFSNRTIGNRDIVRFIAEKEFVSQAVASKLWSTYVDALTDKLKTEKSYVIEGFAILKVESNGSYSLIPDKNLILSENSYGLKDLDNVQTFIPKTGPAPEKSKDEVVSNQEPEGTTNFENNIVTPTKIEVLEQKKEPAFKEKIIEPIPPTKENVVQKNLSKTEALTKLDSIIQDISLKETVKKYTEHTPPAGKQPINDIISNEEKEQNGNKTKQTILRVILSLIVLCALYFCYLFYEKYENPATNKKQTQAIEPPKVEEEIIVKIAPQEVSEKAEDVVIIANNKPQPEPSPESIPSRKNLTGEIEFAHNSYNGIDVIVGFFKVKENAIKEAKRMQSLGYSSYIIQRERQGEEHYFVSIGSFSKNSEAASFMKKAFSENQMEMVIKKW